MTVLNLDKSVKTLFAEQDAKQQSQRTGRMQRHRDKLARRHPALNVLEQTNASYGFSILALVTHFTIVNFLIEHHAQPGGWLAFVLISLLIPIGRVSKILSKFKAEYKRIEEQTPSGELENKYDTLLVKDIAKAISPKVASYAIVLGAPAGWLIFHLIAH